MDGWETIGANYNTRLDRKGKTLKSCAMVAPSFSGEGVLVECAKSVPVDFRKQEFLARWLELAHRDKDIEAIRNCARDAMLNATAYVRAPDPDSKRGWSYMLVKDHPVRLVAANILAEVAGLKGSRAAVNVSMNDNRVQLSVQERALEMESCGIRPEELKQAILRAADEMIAEAKPKQ